MIEEATQEGASAADKLMARWNAEPETPEETPEEPNLAAEEGGDEPEAGAEPEASEAREYDLTEIASVLGYDESDLSVDEDGAVKVKVKIDGEERFVTPAELRKSFQLEGHLNKNNMEVAEQRKSLQAKEQELTQSFQQKLTEAQNLAQLAYNQLAQDFQSIDWDKLRAEDPVEYTVQRQNFNERNAAIQNGLQYIQQQTLQARQQQRDAEMQKLMERIPEWRDESVFRKESEELVKTLGEYGVQKSEAMQIADHRFFLIARDAKRYRELQAKKPEVTKRVKTAPKVVKPGQPASQSVDQKKIADLRKRAKNGERGAVAGLLQERWAKK